MHRSDLFIPRRYAGRVGLSVETARAAWLAFQVGLARPHVYCIFGEHFFIKCVLLCVSRRHEILQTQLCSRAGPFDAPNLTEI